jgi:F-type H+-transporting ATPase subunit c
MLRSGWRNGAEGGKVRKYVPMILAGLGAMLVAAPAWAQTAAGEAAKSGGGMGVATWVAITSGFSMAIASAGCGYAQGKATAAACEGLARNPGARPGIQFALILALVLIESMALYTFAIIFAKVTIPS